MSKPQRQCIFCENQVNSKEHFWSEWMHPLLPQLPDPTHTRKTHDFHPRVGHLERGRSGRPGGAHTIKIRAVCKDCNNGWMNRLERDARPFLTPLIEGTPIALDFIQMSIIARWIALKCIVAEHSSGNADLTPRQDRIAFRENGTIPEYFRIYVANHNLSGITFVRHSLCLAVNGPEIDPPLMGARKTIQTITFLLGRIVVHLNAARIKNYTIESRYRTTPINVWDHCRLWPIQHHEAVWPRRPILDATSVVSISNALATIVSAGDITWGDPDG